MDGCHAVEIRAFIAVNLDVDGMLIYERGSFRIFKRFMCKYTPHYLDERSHTNGAFANKSVFRKLITK